MPHFTTFKPNAELGTSKQVLVAVRGTLVRLLMYPEDFERYHELVADTPGYVAENTDVGSIDPDTDDLDLIQHRFDKPEAAEQFVQNLGSLLTRHDK
jgi:hypothetical protein